MTESRGRASSQRSAPFAALGSTLLGPCGAWLHESGRLDVFGDATLFSVWLVVILALAGLVIGAYAFGRGARLLGALSLVVNGLVVAFYGFLGLFFGLGGSR